MLMLTNAAFAQIGQTQSQYRKDFPSDPPDTLAIGMGQFLSNEGPVGGKTIAVGFFRRSEITPHLRNTHRLVRGMRYVVLGSPETKRMFEKALLDYSTERGFFIHDQ